MEPDMRHWQPLVVDIPTVEFEPKPTPPTWFAPDYVCDGWSTADFTVRLASVRGYAHRYDGTHRQDAVQAGVHPPTGCLVFAVADGVSEAPRSHEGAAIACSASISAVMFSLDRDPSGVDWWSVLGLTATSMARQAEKARIRDVEAQYATTLVLGYARPTSAGARVGLVQVGDSGAWLLQGGQYWPALDEKGGGVVISSAVEPLPRVPDSPRTADFDLPADAVLLVGTDGFGDPLGDGTGLVGKLFADVLAVPPPPLGLAHTLDFSRETFDDDRTLLAVWPAAKAGRK